MFFYGYGSVPSCPQPEANKYFEQIENVLFNGSWVFTHEKLMTSERLTSKGILRVNLTNIVSALSEGQEAWFTQQCKTNLSLWVSAFYFKLEES